MFDLGRKDTICALATPPLASAIAVIRVSGPDALSVRERLFVPRRKVQKNFVATLGDLIDPHSKEAIDEVLCVYFPGGKSYTGEPAFELSIHGSPMLAKRALEALVCCGCRLAEPGEFSLRAVLNQKLDLAAAEGVADLIHARSEEAARAALKNLKGGLAQYLEPTRMAIVEILCEIEARLDFPDEDLGEANRTKLGAMLCESIEKLEQLLKTAQMGQQLMQGARIVLFGAPNAGKSTLMNRLVGQERAIVHHSPGTTRDSLEAAWVVGGIPITLVDVAGVRHKEGLDPVEQIGIERALTEVNRADIVLRLRDATIDEDEFHESLKDIRVPVVNVFTKIDLIGGFHPHPALSRQRERGICVSAKTGVGIDELTLAVRSLLIQQTDSQADVILTRARQREEVLVAHHALNFAKEALTAGDAHEVVASELRLAGGALDRLLGKTLSEDVLDLIFTRFCIGK